MAETVEPPWAQSPITPRRRFHPEADLGGFTDLDGSIRFYLRVNALLSPDAVAVDVGCGRGTQGEDDVRIRRELRILRGKCRRVLGIDVDPGAMHNPYIDEFRLIPADGSWPLEAASADLLLADWVLEHVADPRNFMSEAARVLRPGGHLCIRTINLHGYVGAASHLIPNALHKATLGRITPRRSEQDVFPTCYRCNTTRKLRRELEAADFDALAYGFEGDPSYLEFTTFTYALGLLFQRLAPNTLRFGLYGWGVRRA